MNFNIFNKFFTYSSSLFLLGFVVGGSAIAQISQSETIRGTAGGGVATADCGFIRQNPHHVINLTQRVHSLHLKVEAGEGKPTLLIIGPNKSDRTCILGDVSGGRLPEVGGVWASGQYSIYVGDLEGKQYPFTLRVINK